MAAPKVDPSFTESHGPRRMKFSSIALPKENLRGIFREGYRRQNPPTEKEIFPPKTAVPPWEIPEKNLGGTRGIGNRMIERFSMGHESGFNSLELGSYGFRVSCGSCSKEHGRTIDS